MTGKAGESDLVTAGTAAALAANHIVKCGITVDAVGHRFVHGGEYFKQSTLLDKTSLAKIKKLIDPVNSTGHFFENVRLSFVLVLCLVSLLVMVISAEYFIVEQFFGSFGICY